jgi:starvation-inducible DNA-binding protein
MPNDKQFKDHNEEFATQRSTPPQLCADNQQLTRSLRFTHDVCEQHNEGATVSLLENWIDA